MEITASTMANHLDGDLLKEWLEEAGSIIISSATYQPGGKLLVAGPTRSRKTEDDQSPFQFSRSEL